MTITRTLGTTLLCASLLLAGCGGDGGDGGDAGGDTGGSSETLTLEEFSIEANSLCRDTLTAPITDDPEAYAEAADELEALSLPDDHRATDLVTAMRAFVTAHDDIISRVAEIPDFESPPGTWLLTEDGSIFVSSTGSAMDVEDSGIPTSVGQEYLDLRDALSEAAWSAEAPSCEAVAVE